jgi:hypothetical protein
MNYQSIMFYLMQINFIGRNSSFLKHFYVKIETFDFSGSNGVGLVVYLDEAVNVSSQYASYLVLMGFHQIFYAKK